MFQLTEIFSILLSAMDVQPELCAICKTSVDTSVPSSTVTTKGSSTINQVSIARNDSIHTMPGDIGGGIGGARGALAPPHFAVTP